MPLPLLAPLVISAISGVAGALANRGQKQKSTTKPVWDDQYGALGDVMLKNIMARLSQPGGLPAGYEADQMLGINKTYDLAGKGLANRLAARGLARSPVAGAGEATLETGRAGSLSELTRSLPLLSRQLQNEDLSLAQALMGMNRGQETVGQRPSDMLAGGIGSGASMLGWLYGQDKSGMGGSPLGAPMAPIQGISMGMPNVLPGALDFTALPKATSPLRFGTRWPKSPYAVNF